MKPKILDPNATFKQIISATQSVDFTMASSAMGDLELSVPGGQPSMNPTRTVNDGLYKRGAAKPEDPNWNTDAPPFGDQYPASPDLTSARLPNLPKVELPEATKP